MKEQWLNLSLVITAYEKINFSSNYPIKGKKTWYIHRGATNYAKPKQKVHAAKLGKSAYAEINYTGCVDVILHNKLREYMEELYVSYLSNML